VDAIRVILSLEAIKWLNKLITKYASVIVENLQQEIALFKAKDSKAYASEILHLEKLMQQFAKSQNRLEETRNEFQLEMENLIQIRVNYHYQTAQEDILKAADIRYTLPGIPHRMRIYYSREIRNNYNKLTVDKIV